VAAAQIVVAGRAVERVGAGAASDRVAAVAAVEEVQPQAAAQLVVAVAPLEPAPGGADREVVLSRAAEHVLDALIRDAQFVAWGPAVAADFDASAIEVECTVDEALADASDRKISEVVQRALAECDYDVQTSLRPLVLA